MHIKDSFDEVLSQSDGAFAKGFYERLFASDPNMAKLFEGTDMQRQGVMLLAAIQVLVYHDRKPYHALKEYLWILGYRHYMLGVRYVHYQKFQDALLETLADFHGSGWSDTLAAEWHDAIEKGITLMLHNPEESSGKT